MSIRKTAPSNGFRDFVAAWRRDVMDRRTFLQRVGALGLAASFPVLTGAAAVPLPTAQRWQVSCSVQRHMLPSEPKAPGADEINALGYLKWVVADERLDTEERGFILQGAQWLEDLSRDLTGQSFLSLDETGREQVMRRVAQSKAGENWLSTLLLYIFEALLVDPVYGANPDGVGWQWLGHQPGLPRPVVGKRYGELS